MCGLTANVNREVFVSSSVRTPTLIPTPECRQPSTGVSPAEVAELEHGGLGVQQQVLGLDVPVADPKRVDVGQAPEQLVHVQLHPNTHTHTQTQTGHYAVQVCIQQAGEPQRINLDSSFI